MTFAWQGLYLEHPPDWAPAALNGDRKEGYVRIADSAESYLQLRWKTASAKPESSTVNNYLDRLSKDAQRAGRCFERKVAEKGLGVEYSYKSELHARGVLFRPCDGDRIVFLEVVGSSPSALAGPFREAVSSFGLSGGPMERWSILGLDVLLPCSLALSSHELRAGKTTIRMQGKGMTVMAERWGFAAQLLAKHELPSWAAAVAGVGGGRVTETDDGVELSLRRSLFPSVYVLAKVQPVQNQISVIKVETRNASEKPQWNWFV